MFARFGIPELDGIVRTSRGDLATIRGIRHTYSTCMPLKGGELPARFGIPELDGLVRTSRGDLPPSGEYVTLLTNLYALKGELFARFGIPA